MIRKEIICTKDDPWDGAPFDRTAVHVTHPDAKQVGDSDDTVSYACPHCGHYWTQELPQ